MSNEEVIIICGPQSFFLDDVKVNCVDCGAEVFHRSHTPPGIHICWSCVAKRAMRDPSFRPRICVTKETIKEVLEEIKMREVKH